mmetsp:Transcript_11704/g.30510  ORF Transcript_11704/g.30510 Transcript_11704/m.30510 type:complete len:217 (+) Transcript_11704:769-1419(+)
MSWTAPRLALSTLAACVTTTGCTASTRIPTGAGSSASSSRRARARATRARCASSKARRLTQWPCALAANASARVDCACASPCAREAGRRSSATRSCTRRARYHWIAIPTRRLCPPSLAVSAWSTRTPGAPQQTTRRPCPALGLAQLCARAREPPPTSCRVIHAGAAGAVRRQAPRLSVMLKRDSPSLTPRGRPLAMTISRSPMSTSRALATPSKQH